MRETMTRIEEIVKEAYAVVSEEMFTLLGMLLIQ